MTNVTPVKIAYKTFKPKNADDNLSPIIFLHGMCGNKEQWENTPQVVADQTSRMCYAIDARNHGDSEYTESFNFDMNTVDILHFMDSIGASKVILVGVSMGGCTAIGAALARPEKIEKIVSIDMHTKKFDKDITDMLAGFINLWMKAVHQLPKDLPLEEAITQALDFLYNSLPSNTLIPSKEKMRAVGKNMFKRADGTYDVHCNKQVILDALKDCDTLRSDSRGVFEGAAQFMYGTLSPFLVGKEEANIRKHFPNAEFVEFKGATHALTIECPEQFLQMLIKFLS